MERGSSRKPRPGPRGTGRAGWLPRLEIDEDLDAAAPSEENVILRAQVEVLPTPESGHEQSTDAHSPLLCTSRQFTSLSSHPQRCAYGMVTAIGPTLATSGTAASTTLT